MERPYKGLGRDVGACEGKPGEVSGKESGAVQAAGESVGERCGRERAAEQQPGRRRICPPQSLNSEPAYGQSHHSADRELLGATRVVTISTSPQPVLGAALRSLRQSRQLSVRQVAEAAAISPSFLSLVETGKSDITIGRLTRLVAFFGVSLLDLLPKEPPADTRVVRRHEQPRLRSPAEGIDISLLVPDAQRAMMPMLLSFEPGAELAE